MRTIMKIENLKATESLEEFLQGNQKVAFSVLGSKTERYHFIRKTLIKFSYITLPKKEKGTVIRYLLKMTEYSRQQLTRLIKKYTKTGRLASVMVLPKSTLIRILHYSLKPMNFMIRPVVPRLKSSVNEHMIFSTIKPIKG